MSKGKPTVRCALLLVATLFALPTVAGPVDRTCRALSEIGKQTARVRETGISYSTWENAMVEIARKEGLSSEIMPGVRRIMRAAWEMDRSPATTKRRVYDACIKQFR